MFNVTTTIDIYAILKLETGRQLLHDQSSVAATSRSGIREQLGEAAQRADTGYYSPNAMGAAVAEQLDRSPPTKPNRVQSLAGSLLIFANGNRAGLCGWSVGFLRDLPFPPSVHFGDNLYSPDFTLIASQDLAVKSHPNIFTHS
ncbi:hypothetical protein PR048_014336 [Dryococelus australis]|uniref:Uncharacterized protein n=1 Tax=Dryococelus australis TaxID=614101 RepID=A0ABQ9HDV9_9NEOP|nr:hypothetical protein PR048_014336 [Dryococelus australis]